MHRRIGVLGEENPASRVLIRSMSHYRQSGGWQGRVSWQGRVTAARPTPGCGGPQDTRHAAWRLTAHAEKPPPLVCLDG